MDSVELVDCLTIVFDIPDPVYGCTDAAADRMIENVIGTMSLPVGVATNFILDGKHYVVPFCLEESSVVAAASNMAKRCHASGGFISIVLLLI